MDAVSSASVVQILCDTAVQWDCNLPAMYEKIEHARFLRDVVTPIILVVYITIVFTLPIYLLRFVK